MSFYDAAYLDGYMCKEAQQPLPKHMQGKDYWGDIAGQQQASPEFSNYAMTQMAPKWWNQHLLQNQGLVAAGGGGAVGAGLGGLMGGTQGATIGGVLGTLAGVIANTFFKGETESALRWLVDSLNKGSLKRNWDSLMTSAKKQGIPVSPQIEAAGSTVDTVEASVGAPGVEKQVPTKPGSPVQGDGWIPKTLSSLPFAEMARGNKLVTQGPLTSTVNQWLYNGTPPLEPAKALKGMPVELYKGTGSLDPNHALKGGLGRTPTRTGIPQKPEGGNITPPSSTEVEKWKARNQALKRAL